MAWSAQHATSQRERVFSKAHEKSLGFGSGLAGERLYKQQQQQQQRDEDTAATKTTTWAVLRRT